MIIRNLQMLNVLWFTTHIDMAMQTRLLFPTWLVGALESNDDDIHIWNGNQAI